MRPLLLTILSVALFGIGILNPATAPAAVTGAAVHTSTAELGELSRPAVIANARDPEMPAPATGLNTPSLPPAQASAKRSDIEIRNASAYPNRIQGLVVVRFEHNPKQTYSCSGTLVDSIEKNVLLTAGHCSYSHEANAYPSAMVFIPGYDNGAQPYGVIAVTSVKTTRAWVKRSDLRYDIGIAQLKGTPEKQLGARGIAFDLNPHRRRFRIYGYPAAPHPPYDGQKLIRCDAGFRGRDGTGSLAPLIGGPCYMQQGASGGGWITAGGYVNSITSYTECEGSPRRCGVLFGPYFSNQARSLYMSVATTVRPRVKFVKPPPHRSRKRRIKVRLGGSGSTPVKDFSCKLDHRSFQPCFPSTVISNLSHGRHRLVVKGEDQTGRGSRNRVSRHFRIKPKHKHRRARSASLNRDRVTRAGAG